MKQLIIAFAFLSATAASADAEVRALVIDPPSNIRSSPNGTIICQVTQRTYISIDGATPNGQWYKTDFCGRPGYIHYSQITQPENAAPPGDSETSGYCILRGQPVPDHYCW